MSKTQVILRSEDGRQEVLEFDTYEQALDAMSKAAEKSGVKFNLEQWHHNQTPTVEVYRERTDARSAQITKE